MPNPTQNSPFTPDNAANPSLSEKDGGGAAPAKKSAARFITPVLAIVAALGIGLFGGVLIGQNTASSTQAGRGDGQSQGFPGGTADGDTTGGPGGGMGNFTSGTVTAIDGDTVTLELADGSTVTITTTDDTTVTTTAESAVSDLATGDSLTVIGEADDDGNVAATSITEGSTGMGGFGGGTPPTAPTAK